MLDKAERILRLRGTTSMNGYILPTNKASLALCKKNGYALFDGSKNGLVVAVEKTFKK